ncbi:cyclase-associated protein 1-like isoform X1 [Phoenix dactylifera]|uniref:Adenylyl cyclase-associated protein n=1 Tax=Phoenix dactylifera TaxID=42345 RepID=A0A8B9AWR7_PHODC|nr:cyclase-associated protein 1-like isoform X1 [Phoenix dactylifera]
MEKELVERLEAAVARLEVHAAAGSRSSVPSIDLDGAAFLDPAISAFDDLMSGSLARVSAAAGKIGGKVLEATKIVEEAFAVQKDLLVKAKQCEKPDIMGLQEFLKPLNELILKASALTEGRRSDYFNHLKAAADSLTALAWIAYLGKDCGTSLPIAYVEESWQMTEFYNNKVLVEYRNKDPDHVEWAKALKELYLPGLRDYVKVFYPLGPVWGPAGSAAPSSAPSTSKAPLAKAPAPPPPPSTSLFSSENEPLQPKQGMSAVFQEIKSGKTMTAGLRKVTDDMKTKNRTDRTVDVGTTEKDSRASSFSFSKTGPPKLELQMGRKWAIENQIGRKDLVIDDCDSKQSVYLFGCKDSVLQVKGKMNNITVDKCTKMGIVFTDVVAACEIVNCNGVEVQCQGSASTISIDNTSGCQLYLSKDSLEASITTAKSSEINVMIPGAGPDDDWGLGCIFRAKEGLSSFAASSIGSHPTQISKDSEHPHSSGCMDLELMIAQSIGGFARRKAEHALPQQYVHAFKDGQFTTSPVSHSAG